jgi:N-acetyltransferase
VHALARIKSYHDYGSFTPIQVASIVALEGPQECVEEIRKTYEKRRNVMVKALQDAGWMVEKPKASMYIWARIPEFYAKMGSIEFTKRLMEEAKIAVAPGHRLRRLRRRPRAHRADRERAPPAPGGARHPRHVPQRRPAAWRGVIELQPSPLEGHGVRLEPLSPQHEAGLKAAAADGKLWELFFTSVPEPDQVAAYISSALEKQRQGEMLAWAVRDLKSGDIVGSTRYHDIIAAADRVEIGYTWYAQRCQRSHVNTACKLLLFTHGFETVGCKVVGLRTDNFNFRSQKAIEALDPPPLAAARRQHPRHRDVQRAARRMAVGEETSRVQTKKK